MTRRFIIGTRGSKLALWQANWVKNALETRFAAPVDLVIIKTRGDKITDVPLAKVGGSALFVKELEQALTEKRIDIAVHSMKDMPSTLSEALAIGAVPEREIPWDALISKDNLSFDRLPIGARIGTSSLRRQSQLLHLRPDLSMVSLRGNLDTRIQKLYTDDLHAVVVAAAGLRRLGFEDKISQILTDTFLLPAVGQGALCIEIRKEDADTAQMVSPLDHETTHLSVRAERAFLRKLGGSCQVPMAGYGKINEGVLTLAGAVASLDGKTIFRDSVSGPSSDPEPLGILLADRLLSRGADDVLKEILSEAADHDPK